MGSSVPFPVSITFKRTLAVVRRDQVVGFRVSRLPKGRRRESYALEGGFARRNLQSLGNGGGG